MARFTTTSSWDMRWWSIRLELRLRTDRESLFVMTLNAIIGDADVIHRTGILTKHNMAQCAWLRRRKVAHRQNSHGYRHLEAIFVCGSVAT